VSDDYWTGTDILAGNYPPKAQPVPFDRLADGTIVRRRTMQTPLAHHYGFKIGWDEVLHIDKSEAGLIRVRRESFAEFAAGHPVEIGSGPPPGLDIWQIEVRLLDLQQKQVRYDLLGLNGMNCESFVRYLVEGKATSTQVQNAVALGALGLLVYLAAKK
jgi:hypothetical protein